MTRPQTSIDRLGIDQPENIMKSAEKVFWQKRSWATMADIASEAGISQGLAYKYFESNDEIFKTLSKHPTICRRI
jgi:AcrR family transcriptional regulator